jgi:hypothetical protein
MAKSFLKSLLKTSVYLMDQFSDQVDRASDRVSDLSDRGKKLIYPEQDNTLRNLAVFATGVGVGVGLGILFAPASGKETRDSLNEKVQNISDQVGERLRSTARPPSTGTDSV